MVTSKSKWSRVWPGLVLAALVASSGLAHAQDAAKGKRVFNKCKSCHQVGEGAKNRTGPVLNGVVGSPAGQHEGYNYSKAMAESGLTWDHETLARFLAKPKEAVPGTKMGFAGLRKEKDIENVIAYLETFAADGSASE